MGSMYNNNVFMYVTFKLEVLYRHHPLFHVAFIYGISSATLGHLRLFPARRRMLRPYFVNTVWSVALAPAQQKYISSKKNPLILQIHTPYQSRALSCKQSAINLRILWNVSIYFKLLKEIYATNS